MSEETTPQAIEPESPATAAPEAKPKPARKASKGSGDIVWYESREPEPTQFSVAGYNPIRNFANGRLEFRVRANDVKRFEQNHFCMNARIVRKRS